MTSKQETSVSFDQMKGAVGSLLFLWSQTERELTSSIHLLSDESRPKLPHGIARSIDRWSEQMKLRAGQLDAARNLCDHLVTFLKEALFVRNLVCHGLIGITAQLSPAHQEACLTVEMDNKTRKLTWVELETMFHKMDEAMWFVRNLTDVVLSADQRRGDEMLQSWRRIFHQRS